MGIVHGQVLSTWGDTESGGILASLAMCASTLSRKVNPSCPRPVSFCLFKCVAAVRGYEVHSRACMNGFGPDDKMFVVSGIVETTGATL
jgi:hypothetical protein